MQEMKEEKGDVLRWKLIWHQEPPSCPISYTKLHGISVKRPGTSSAFLSFLLFLFHLAFFLSTSRLHSAVHDGESSGEKEHEPENHTRDPRGSLRQLPSNLPIFILYFRLLPPHLLTLHARILRACNNHESSQPRPFISAPDLAFILVSVLLLVPLPQLVSRLHLPGNNKLLLDDTRHTPQVFY